MCVRCLFCAALQAPMKTVDEAVVRKNQEVRRNSEQKIITTTADLISNLTPPPPPVPPRILAHSPPTLRLSSHFTEYFSMQGGAAQGSKA